jgi:aromatic ring-opening dioxygenase catalytic subunit (LigB family)
MTASLPTYFISHGGGPWPWMADQLNGMYRNLAASLADMPRQIGVTPKALLVISGHWEERDFAVMAHPHPPMLYDYYGFPPHTYEINYGAPGSPAVAARVLALLQAAGLKGHLDRERGFDHGTFTPVAVMYPNADVPVVQLSLRADFDPRAHLALGHALAPLRDEGVLIVGSGLSYHNLRAMGPMARAPSKAFDGWLDQTLATTDPTRREARLIDWEAAPSARFAHPREEHLLPLMVAVGAAGGEAATRVYHEDTFFGGVTVSSYRFGPAAA